MKFLLAEEDKIKDNYLAEGTTPEVDSLGNPLTPEQVKFFANSKVRDNKGNLLVCYHNTDNDFDIFDKQKVKTGTFGNGFYFTTSERNASSYGGKFTKQYYLNITKPAFIDEQYEDIHEYLEAEFGVDDFNVLLERGYDGIVTPMYWGDDMFEYYVALEPDQIKSITNTNPTSSNNINEDISLQDKHSVREFADECKVDGLLLMNYKEFSELLNEQGMKPNEELYQVYVDAYNNEEDTDYIEVIRKKFEKMSSNEIIDLLGIPNSSNIDSDSPMFILPNGSIISVAQAGKLIGQELQDNIHSDMVYVILSAIAKKYNYDWDMDDGYYEERKLSFLTYDLGWARLNCGETWAETRFYCVLPNHMTSAQYRSLEKWFEWGADTGKKEVLVFVGSYQDNNTYSFKDNLPEDIIKKIKRYYSSGKLYENRKELKETMEELIKDFSKVGNPKNGDRLTIIDDKDREWNYVAYLWSAPGFTSGMAWKGQKGNPWVTDVAANPRAFNSDFPRGVKSITLNDMNEKIMTESIKPGDRVKMDYYAKANNGATGTCKGRIGQLCSIEWDDGSKSKEITTYLTKIEDEPITESNELEQRAKKHKKKSKGMGWHMAVNAGDVEKGIEVFNNSTSLGSGTSGVEGTAMGEALDQNTYYYDGPIYYDGRKISEKSDIYTTAKSVNLAIRNILYKAARGDKELYHYDIADDRVREVPKNETPKIRPKCQTCGYELNDIGDCPVCDYGEDDLLESLSSLEALWELSNLD